MMKISETIKEVSHGLRILCAKNVDEIIARAKFASLAGDYTKAEMYLDSLGYVLAGMQAIDGYCNGERAFQYHLLVSIRESVFENSPCREFISKHRNHPVFVLSEESLGCGKEVLDFHLAKAWRHLPHELQVRSMAEAMMCVVCAFNEPGPLVEDSGFEDLAWGLPEPEGREQLEDEYSDVLETDPDQSEVIAFYRLPAAVYGSRNQAAFIHPG